jgi:cytochrome c biogenesis protein CcmG/thiol:disulfide interchange protein DsbE
LKTKTSVLLIILLSTVFSFSVIQCRRSPRAAKVGEPVPDVTLIDNQENKVRLSELKGSVVFVNFWASWCPPCIEEVPSIEALFRNLSKNPKFKMITILYRDDIAGISNTAKQQGYTFPIYRDPDGSAAIQFGITGVPETFIIDKKGTLRDKVIGPYTWDSPAVTDTLLKLINE